MQIEQCNKNECIKNLTGIKKNNELQLKWDWPEINTGIDYVYIFEIETENETLYDLSERNAKHFSVSRKTYIENNCYKKTLLDNSIQYKIFPVKIEKSKALVLNQQLDNITKIFYKTVIIEYTLTIKTIGQKKKINFVFSNLDAIININEIVYHKYDKNNKYICTYPLSIDLILKNDYNITINRNEQIRLALKDKDSDIIKFKLK